MKWNNNVLKEDDVLFSERDSEARNDTGQDIEQFSRTVELVSLVNQSVETFVHRLSNHFSPWYQLSIELVKDIFEIVSFD